MILKKYKYNGLPFYTITDQYDCPIDPYISNYINSYSNKGPKTVEKYTNELLFVLDAFKYQNINLIERIIYLSFIELYEYQSFNETAYLLKNTEKSTYKKSSNKKISDISLEDKFIRNVMTANQKVSLNVSGTTISGRLKALRLFLEWLFNQFHFYSDVSKKNIERYRKLICKIKFDESSFASRNSNKKVSSPEESVIPDEIFLKLLACIEPHSDLNPFKGSKIRNYLIVAILMQTGIRRGALAKMKISDCHFYGTYDQISIYPNPRDPTDVRLDLPNQKKGIHRVSITKELMIKLKYYIDYERSSYSASQTHDFIFISEKDSRDTIGLPLAVKSINGIFDKISLSLAFDIFPHLLRYKWNEIFDEQVELSDEDNIKAEEMRKYAMGWSQNTKMTTLYNEKKLSLKVRELSLNHQKKLNDVEKK